ncbi:hypothetical protein ACFQVC_17795 [Streptomyces monticola]|uniref:Uncharacterized protein n=1 Tax=Streptomyces monticola TaxID=2666263 RepID=A0ABW2JIX4_9ACTN
MPPIEVVAIHIGTEVREVLELVFGPLRVRDLDVEELGRMLIGYVENHHNERRAGA